MKNDLQPRLFNFAVRVFNFNRTLPETTEFSVVRYQLAKSSTSAGANYEESQADSSRRDFIYKIEIALREMRESNYWQRLIDATTQNIKMDRMELTYLVNESKELKNILGSIVSKSKTNDKG